jgi:hypothetical protein
MANSFDMEKAKSISRIIKHSLAERFSDPVDCLTAHLIFESSEVIAKTKPANLVSLVNRPLACGANLYELWNQHRDSAILRLAGLKLLILKQSEKSVLLLCYNSNVLAKHLSHPGIMTLLTKAGYESPASPDQLLNQLKSRIERDGDFPHEIGLFIGYPAKDVAAFMGTIKIPFTCQGPWKIYGDPTSSLNLVKDHLISRVTIAKKLSRCLSPEEFINPSEQSLCL